jgi:hypothetical protein
VIASLITYYDSTVAGSIRVAFGLDSGLLYKAVDPQLAFLFLPIHFDTTSTFTFKPHPSMSGLPPSLLSLLVTRPVSTRDQDAMDTDDSIRSTISSANTDTSLRAPQVTPQQRRQVTTTPSQSMQTDLDTPTNTRPVLSHQSSSVREIPSSTSSTSYPAYPSYPGSYRGRPPTPSPISNDAPDRAGDYKMGDSTQSSPTPVLCSVFVHLFFVIPACRASTQLQGTCRSPSSSTRVSRSTIR